MENAFELFADKCAFKQEFVKSKTPSLHSVVHTNLLAFRNIPKIYGDNKTRVVEIISTFFRNICFDLEVYSR